MNAEPRTVQHSAPETAEGGGTPRADEVAARFGDPERTRASYTIFRRLMLGIGRLYFRAEAIDLERVPKTGACLILPNHASFLDPCVAGMFIRRECHFLGRTGVAHAPLLGRVLRHFNTDAIRRGGVDREAIKTCVAVLGAGFPLVMFPEGTRSPDGKITRPKGGFGMILERMPDVPCVPAYIEGAGRALGRGAILPRPAKIRVFYGEPFTFEPRGEQASRREYYQRCAERLERAWRELEMRAQES